MPHRLNQFRAKLQFVSFAAMPNMIYQACKATGTVSQTRYVQEAVCEKLARDLDIPVDHLYARLPAPRGPASALLVPPTGHRIGPANTVEEVR